jgi:hypothetical protein
MDINTIVLLIQKNNLTNEQISELIYNIARSQWGIMVHLCTMLTGKKPDWKKTSESKLLL